MWRFPSLNFSSFNILNLNFHGIHSLSGMQVYSLPALLYPSDLSLVRSQLTLLQSALCCSPYAIPLCPLYLHTFPLNLKTSTENDEISLGDLDPTVIDMDIFNQLLEMDDEEDREFSKSIVWNYFDQAESTFGNMDDAL